MFIIVQKFAVCMLPCSYLRLVFIRHLSSLYQLTIIIKSFVTLRATLASAIYCAVQ